MLPSNDLIGYTDPPPVAFLLRHFDCDMDLRLLASSHEQDSIFVIYFIIRL